MFYMLGFLRLDLVSSPNIVYGKACLTIDFFGTPTPRKNAYKPSLYDICLEYGIKDVKFIKQIKTFSRQNLRLPVRVQTACFLSFFDVICVRTSTY
jgi:hypothetical protein